MPLELETNTEIPLARIYWGIFWCRRSGQLTLERGSHRKDLYFRQGEPFLAKSSHATDSMARFLLDRGLLDEDRLDRAALLSIREQRSLSDALTSSGAIRSNVLGAAQVERVRELFLSAFRMQQATFTFTDDPSQHPPSATPRSDFFGLLREAVVRYQHFESLMGYLEPLGTQPLIRTGAFLRTIREIRLTTTERRIVHAIDGRRRIGDLMAHLAQDPKALFPTLYLAHCIGLVRGVDEAEVDEARPDFIDTLRPVSRRTLLEELLALPDPPVRERVLPPAAPAWKPREGRRFGGDHTTILAESARGSTAPARSGGSGLAALAADEDPSSTVAAAMAPRGYRVIEAIGRGAWGWVFRAQQEMLDRPVAVKVMSPQFLDDPTFRERFLLEARQAAQLNHPNVVAIFECNESLGVHYLVMELMEGPTLRERVSRSGPMAEAEALTILTEIAEALEHAHGKGTLHRDVKPENVFLGRDGHIKLGDWGLAKPMTSNDASLTQTGIVLGTPYYISPEQLKGLKDIDARADIYSLGATFYYLLTGRPPFEGPSVVEVLASHLLDAPPDPRERKPSISEATARLVMKALAKSPADRFQSARALAAEAHRILAP